MAPIVITPNFEQFNLKEVQLQLRKLDEDPDFNPWAVSDPSVFLRYSCPECPEQCKSLDTFAQHATLLHIKVRKKSLKSYQFVLNFLHILLSERGHGFYGLVVNF
jgi:hypothetical protein